MLTFEWIEARLSSELGEPVEVLTRQQSRYSTSFTLDDVTARSESGRELRLVVKNLAWDALLPDARRTKPRFLYDPNREIGVYAKLLAPERFGTPRAYTATESEDRALILEKLNGRELFQVGERDLWVLAAEWARRLHEAFEAEVPALEASGVPLLRHDGDFYRAWFERARKAVADERLDFVGAHYARVVQCLLGQPQTLIHGELYASNVIVSNQGRVAVVDWEMAAIGPGCVDIAALTSGRGWSAGERQVLVDAYVGVQDDRDLRLAIEAARVYLAVQWLGWSDGWTPPADRAQDWLADACDAIHRMGL